MTRRSKREIERRLDEMEPDEEMDDVERWRAFLRGDLPAQNDENEESDAVREKAS